MKRFLRLLLITIIIFTVAVAAAPMFVRQDQIKSFIEKKVILPDNKKLRLEGNISFGIFPYAHVDVPSASIINEDGAITKFEDFSFGFNISDLFDDSITFDSAFRYGVNNFEGNFHIEDYNSFLKNGQSPVILKLEKPLAMKIKGDFIHQENLYSLRDFEITHKQTKATGNVKVTAIEGNHTKVELNTVIDSTDIENLRRIVQFGRNNEDFNMLSGNGRLKLNIETYGITSSDFKLNLNGEGELEVADAALYGIDLNEIIGSPSETVLTHNQDRKIDIKEADATFKILNGIINVEKLNANNQFATISGSGAINLPINEIRMGIDIDADIASAQVKIPLLVYGPLDKIKFAPRTGDAILGNLENITDSAVRLKNVKINLNKDNLKESVRQLKDIGKSLGIDLGKALKEVPKEPAAPPSALTPADAPAPSAPAAPAAPATTPASLPASMKQNQNTTGQ